MVRHLSALRYAPMTYEAQQWMHNGGIAQFQLIKRKLQARLPDDIFAVVQGNTG